ncbi:hypothetical protein MASR2M70_05250 [Bacillota bacterium]
MMASMIYYSICLVGLAGGLMVANEAYRWELIKARRWRKAGQGLNLRNSKLFRLYSELMERSRREGADIEIYEAISFMRNTIAIGKGGSLSSDALIEELILRKGNLAPVYGKTLHFLRQNQKDAAAEYFAGATGTKTGKEFARMLIKWDEIEPEQLSETLLSHQINIRETRSTIQKRRDEMVSDLIYLPVVVNIMLIFINFIYVGYFIDQREMLMMML